MTPLFFAEPAGTPVSTTPGRTVSHDDVPGHPRGAAHFRAQLSDDQVRAMRARYAKRKAAGKRYGYEAAAKDFGCGISTARDIILQKTRRL